MTAIDAETVAAYRRTAYRMAPGWSIWIDRYSPELAEWHARQGVESSGFVSAVNPCSQVLPASENERRHLNLLGCIERRGLIFLTGAGVDPVGSWPAEPGCLIAGLGREDAAQLGRRFDQNAVVWSGTDAIPRLILLR